MSFLIPLLLPPIAEATAKVAIGLANASQAESNTFSLTIGNRVFTTSKPFAFTELPFEIRSDILLMALEASKTLIPPLPPKSLVRPDHPFLNPAHPLYAHPMNPYQPSYVFPSGEQCINGYPSSSWRWTLVSREWWAVLRSQLWHNTVLRGRKAYSGFLRILDDDDCRAIKKFIKILKFEEGFSEASTLYIILNELPGLDELEYNPYPPDNYAFPFGINILSKAPGPVRLTLTPPFNLITNPSTRNHLLSLPRLRSLTIHLSQSLSLATSNFLASLPHIREITVHAHTATVSALAPFAQLQTAWAQTEITEDTVLDAIPHLTSLTLHLRQILSDADLEALKQWVSSTESHLATITTIWLLKRPVYLPPNVDHVEEDDDEAKWDRWQQSSGTEKITTLRLFGGLLGLRMESHG
ncbi:hypothetical protein JAAARDRAFT_62240 [Jaapia argillacea MUCL 33604]|uniref:Uncharacterized protein n=1 Tax=Jaapia argillacea MUCL 33604 TaxID=933084 RepID=A0A067PLI6_9AGAM|nr:hypothetical protein JAAARDRAFT_62240 [Jaapia argillacea MUCL 33604]